MTCLTTIGFYWLDEDCGPRYINRCSVATSYNSIIMPIKIAFQIQELAYIGKILISISNSCQLWKLLRSECMQWDNENGKLWRQSAMFGVSEHMCYVAFPPKWTLIVWSASLIFRWSHDDDMINLRVQSWKEKENTNNFVEKTVEIGRDCGDGWDGWDGRDSRACTAV